MTPLPVFRTDARFDALLCDIDGCLCPESGGALDLDRLARVADYNRRAVERRDRPIITVCTGRPHGFAECVCRLLANTVMPCVCENGVWVYHPGDNSFHIDPAITHDHLVAVRTLYDWIDASFGPDGLTIQPGKTASVSPYHPDHDYLQQKSKLIRAQCEAQGWPFRISLTWNYINCDLTHISKATGIHRLIEYAQLDPDRLAGIGDTAGDLAIAQNVAWFAAPDNRHPDLDPVSDYISPHAEIEGVLNILDRLPV